jgi:hypothetical protein
MANYRHPFIAPAGPGRASRRTRVTCNDADPGSRGRACGPTGPRPVNDRLRPEVARAPIFRPASAPICPVPPARATREPPSPFAHSSAHPSPSAPPPRDAPASGPQRLRLARTTHVWPAPPASGPPLPPGPPALGPPALGPHLLGRPRLARPRLARRAWPAPSGPPAPGPHRLGRPHLARTAWAARAAHSTPNGAKGHTMVCPLAPSGTPLNRPVGRPGLGPSSCDAPSGWPAPAGRARLHPLACPRPQPCPSPPRSRPAGGEITDRAEIIFPPPGRSARAPITVLSRCDHDCDQRRKDFVICSSAQSAWIGHPAGHGGSSGSLYVGLKPGLR